MPAPDASRPHRRYTSPCLIFSMTMTIHVLTMLAGRDRAHSWLLGLLGAVGDALRWLSREFLLYRSPCHSVPTVLQWRRCSTTTAYILASFSRESQLISPFFQAVHKGAAILCGLFITSEAPQIKSFHLFECLSRPGR